MVNSEPYRCRTDPVRRVSIMAGRIHNEQGKSGILLVCEHASNHIPTQFNKLGLMDDVLQSHIAWDPGAFEIAQHISNTIDAPLVYATNSRLVFDCNRTPDAVDAIPERSEVYDIPGNTGLSPEQKEERIKFCYTPFHDLISKTIKGHNSIQAIVTVHSFSPVYNGVERNVELGVLHDTDQSLADRIIENAILLSEMKTVRNQPYGPKDGVTHTLKRHGIENNILNVMLELRNDLIHTEAQQIQVASTLSRVIIKSLKDLGITTGQKGE